MPIQSRHSLRLYSKQFEEDNRIPPPSHRHAAPSAPWPWVDIQDEVDPVQLASPLPPIPPACDHSTCNGRCWKGYPQSLFPNWTERQVKKSKIQKAIKDYRRDVDCVLYHVDIDDKGRFKDAGKIIAKDAYQEETWKDILVTERPDHLRVRAIFIENLSGPVLQMLGARFNVEPFFFSSSLNWIPSRYQEEVNPGVGDHVTITLTFIRSIPKNFAAFISASSPYAASSDTLASKDQSLLIQQMIDTQAPLELKSNQRLLVLDLLAVHLIRRKEGSTIISYHPSLNLPTTRADYLHQRIQFAGQSVYWQSIFQKSSDPTFLLLAFIWHAMYAWDEALEHLYAHICTLETKVINTSEMNLTQELHVIRAHHLHYSSLLDDFRKSVEFIRDTVNPAMEDVTEDDREFSSNLMKRECTNLISEIKRLEMSRNMQDRRLKNVMNLVFSSVNILDSKRMQKMTEAAMKQIAYLSMVFLPATFVAGVFGMNVEEINPGTLGTLPHYAATALPFTIVTIWVIIAFQSRYIFPERVTFWKRLGWPVLLLMRMFGKDPYAMNTKDQNLSSEPISTQDGLLRLHET